LSDVRSEHVTKHQVFDIECKVVVSEHQADHKRCGCGHLQSSKLPEGVSAPCQYGPSVKAMAVELTQVQFIPLKRATQFFANKFGLPLSQGSIQKFNQEVYEKLLIWQKKTREDLKQSELLHADETGININGKNAWIHSVSNDIAVLMIPHFKRGNQAIDSIGILPEYHSILCHDFWRAYGVYDAIHVVCHSHIKRELEKAREDYGQKWANKLSKLLQGANELRNKQSGNLNWKQVQAIEKKYDRIIAKAEKKCPLKMKRKKERGRIGQDYPRQLLTRLKSRKSWVLMFLYDPRVPFTNNQAERDIRMAKVQQKISGCFRTFEGAEKFCLIRSFVLTMGKQGKSVQVEIEKILRGT